MQDDPSERRRQMRCLHSVCHLKQTRTHQSLSRTLNTGIHHYPEETFFSYGQQDLNFDQNPPHPSDLKLFSELQNHGTPPNTYTFNRIISSCAKSASLCMGIQVHAVAVKLGFSSNVYISSALVDLYGKCGRTSDAHNMFDQMNHRNVVSWNSLISGYLDVGCPETSLYLFIEMRKEGVLPTPFSISSILVGCSQLEAENLGKQVHCLALKCGICNNVVVGTGLVDMYSKCFSLRDARKIFDQMVEKNLITWTCMITGHAQCEQPDEAMSLVRKMLQMGMRPNAVTYSCLLSTFNKPDYADCSKQVHCRVIREGLESDRYIAVALVTVYSDCHNDLEDFQKVCAGIRWDGISWNAVIAGYANVGDGKESLKCFCKMRKVGIEMDSFTFSSALKAARINSALEEGRQIHCLVFKLGYVCHIQIENGLVAMYAGSGNIGDAKIVFSSMRKHDVISWNSLISGCAHHGFAAEATELFEQMRKTELEPNKTTFLAVLTACSYAGLVEKGLEYFNMMRGNNTIGPPKSEHYATVVNLLGRAGNLQEAEAVINGMDLKPGPSVYKALLSACQIHGNKEMALRTGERLLDLYPDDPATYVLLSNILQTVEDWVDAAELWALMCDRGVRKYPSYSRIVT